LLNKRPSDVSSEDDIINVGFTTYVEILESAALYWLNA